MRSKITLLAALAVSCFSTGCVIQDPYAYPTTVVAPGPDEIIVPSVIIVENGVRHDRYFYHRHPEYYRRDRLRYPERFAPAPRHHYWRPTPAPAPLPPPPRPSYHGYVKPEVRPMAVAPRPAVQQVRPAAAAPQMQQARPGAPRPVASPTPDGHKKRHHGDRDDRDQQR